MRRTITLITTIACCAPLACGPDCPAADTATDGGPDDDPYPDLEADSSGCCYPLIPGEELDICETHPFGRAPGCGGEERPQSNAKCHDLARLNPGLCAGTYVACRDALREAACDACPSECAWIAGACDP